MPSMTRDGGSRKAELFAAPDVHRDFAPSTGRPAVLRVARFCFHFAEMGVAMLLGMMAFRMIRLGLAAHGQPALLDPKAIASSVAMGVFMTAPMVAWMRLRGCPWRDAAEMAGGMLAPWTVVVALGHLGLSEPLPWLSKTGPIAMLLGMLAVMLCRPRSMPAPLLTEARAEASATPRR